MAVLSKEDFLNKVMNRIGDDNSDEAVAFLEDMTDTFNDMERRTNGQEDWQKKYEENDKMWREKYKARFFEGGTTKEQALQAQFENVEADGEPRSFDELFAEREG